MRTRFSNIWNDKIIYIIYATIFLNSVFANVLSFYLSGNTNDNTRFLISWGIILLLDLCIGVKFVKLFLDKKDIRKYCMKKALLPMVFMISILAAIIISGFSNYAIKTFVLFGLYCVPAFFVAIILITENSMEQFFDAFRSVGFILMPYMVIYSIRYLNAKLVDNLQDFGGISYLSIGYAAFIIISFCMGDLYLKLRKGKVKKYDIYFDIIICAFYSSVATLSGSRGVLVVFCIWIVAFSVNMLIRKCKERILIAALVLCLCSMGITTVWSVIHESAGINRTLYLIDEVKNGELEKAISSGEGKEILEEIENKAESESGFRSIVEENKKEVDNSEKEEVIKSISNGSMARVYLYKLAFIEANKTIIWGKGPLGYQLKYETYPHNIILEIMADYGYVVMVIVCIALVLLLINFIKCSKNNIIYDALIIVSVGQAVRMMLSASLYDDAYLIWILVFLLDAIKNNQKETNVENMNI